MSQCFIQIAGPFNSGVDIISILKANYDFTEVIKIGIQTKTGNKFKINDETIEMGKTKIYEVNNIDIDSLSFLQNENESTIIDFIVE